MLTDDQIFLAVLVVVVLLIWSVLYHNSKEKLHAYWHRTNCTSLGAINALKGKWRAVGSNSLYTFTSPVVGLTQAEQVVVGTDKATGAEVVTAILNYARSRGLYKDGESYIKTDSALKDAFSTSSDRVSMKDVGSLGSKIIMSVTSSTGARRDLTYEFEFCFLNTRTGQTYIRLYRPSDNRNYDLNVSATELKLKSDEGEVLLATR